MAAPVPDPPWWRKRGDSNRAERKPLTRDAIVDAALALLEREGLQGVSMRKLAQELGAGAASLYWHVGDKEELLALMLDRIVGEGEVVEPDPEHWQEQVKEMLRAARRLMLKRRDAAQLSLGRIPAGPNSLPVMERQLAVLHAAGLPPRVISYAADMFALFVGGFAFEESMGQEGDPAALGEYFASLPPDRFPTLTALAGDLTEGGSDERFEFAIELLVRGLEAMANRRTTP
jgi:TetR/AcrR family transcriptional regulator, tetracycline repressor protein